MWFGTLCHRRLFNEVVQDILKTVVHIEGSFVGHLGIDQTLIQGHGDLIGSLAQRPSHTPDLIPVKVDGDDLYRVTPIRNLVALAIEAESRSSAGDRLFAVSEGGHVPENFGQLLALPVQADFAVHIQIQVALCCMNGLAQLFALLHQRHQEGSYLVGVAGILTGSSLLHYGILSVRHDLTAQMGGLDLDGVAPVLKNANTKLLITTAAQQLLTGKMTLAALRAEMTRIASQLPEYETVCAMYGVGETTAAQLMAEIGDVRRFPRRSSIVGFAGVDPGIDESGKHSAKSVPTTKRGSPHLRKTLYQIVCTYLKKSPADEPVYQFLDKKRAEGKPYFVYMTAAQNKFLRIYYARVKECLEAFDSQTAEQK